MYDYIFLNKLWKLLGQRQKWWVMMGNPVTLSKPSLSPRRTQRTPAVLFYFYWPISQYLFTTC